MPKREKITQRAINTFGKLSTKEIVATITSIMPGKTGRVLYEGNSWQARCADNSIAIAENELVYVVEKKGNTLIVLPSKLLS